MRIAWFSNIDFQEGNAANSRIRALANGLKANGNHVFLFFLSPTVFNDNGLNKKTKGFFDGIYFNYLSGKIIRSHYLLIRIFTYLKSIFSSSWLLIKKRNHFDIIFIYSPRLLFFGHIYILAKILKIPLILEKTELDHLIIENKSLVSKFAGFTDRLDVYFLKHVCTHLIVISEKLKNYYSQFLPPSKISLVPIIVDLKRFESVNGNGIFPSYTLGYLGSFGAKDGVNGIIEGFKNAIKEVPNLKLKLIGFNPHKKETNLELKRNQLNGQVEKSGQITYDQVPHWLAKCDLLIMNRTNHEFSHYGFPTKLGEYLATGIPTICTRVGDIENYLEHNNSTYIIEPDNSKQLTDAIIERYKNYDTFNAIGQKGKQIAQSHFDYQKYIPVLQSVFEEAILSKKYP
ncbi:MAG: glycosyltransferase family 4 protein [Bacteroidia bacterium]